MLNELGRWLLAIGGMLVILGLILMVVGRLPGLGRLPGDIVIERKNFVFYAPLGTMLLLSIVLTILLNVLFRLFR